MRCWIFTCLLVIALTTSSIAGSSSVCVPAGNAPVLDGRLGADEWRGAHRLPLAPEGEVLVRRSDDALHVGVRLGPSCIPSLALLHDERVHVLHASASLGTAVYERRGDEWHVVRSFDWRCRDGRTNEEERKRFLANEGWVATTVGVGTKGEAEYRIERRLLEGDAPRLAVVACRIGSGPPTACTWPADLADATTEVSLLMGSCATTLAFDPEAWTRLELGPTGTPKERLDRGLDEVEKATEEDPAAAYVLLLDLLAEHPAREGEVAARAKAIRKDLERRREVRGEAKANRALEAALAWLVKNEDRLGEATGKKEATRRLKRVEDRYPGTRAARVASARREGIE